MTEATPEQFTLRSQRMGALPLLGYFLERMGLAEHLQAHLPRDDARLRLAPAAVIGLLVRSIVVARRPLYGLAEWAAPYDPVLLGLEPGDEAMLNDDRVGRTLDRLFDCDRASLITGAAAWFLWTAFVHQAESAPLGISRLLTGSFALLGMPWQVMDPLLIALPLSTLVIIAGAFLDRPRKEVPGEDR